MFLLKKMKKNEEKRKEDKVMNERKWANEFVHVYFYHSAHLLNVINFSIFFFRFFQM